MDKSGDCDSDGSLSWEDFFGSSTDLVPTLLSMYDSLIAAASETLSSAEEQRLLDKLENNSGSCVETSGSSSSATNTGSSGRGYNSNSATNNRYFNPSAQVRWENSGSLGKSGGGGGYHPIRTSCYQQSPVGACELPSNSDILMNHSKMTTKGSCNANLNNNKTVSSSSGKNSVNNQQQRQTVGALSRRLCRWASDPRKSSSLPFSKEDIESCGEKGEADNKSEMCSAVMMTNGDKLLMNGKEQRPMSVNSVISSTSSSSTCSSESSTSLSAADRVNGGGVGETPSSDGIISMIIAPRASPEEEDCAAVLDADISDEEESGLDKIPYHHLHHHHHNHIHQCAKKSNNNNSGSSPPNEHVSGSNGTERCFSNSAAKDCGDSANRSQVQGVKASRCYDPNLSYMDRVVMEIVETERMYTTDLGEIISGYLEYWMDNLDETLRLDDVRELFSNIEQIHRFNSDFLRELEGCGLDPVKVAQCFVRKNEGFSIYTQYCTNYPRTMSILTEMMRHEQTAKSFRERQAALAHSLPLGSYLLKPVQRILKYHLLLQNIVKTYDHGEDGYDLIVEALSAMTNIAHHINDMKRRHEHAVRVQEIQSLLYGWQGEDLTTYGELCAEGTFRAYGAKALRHVFLFDKMVLITKKKEDGILSYKTHIMANNLMLIESVPGGCLSFQLIPFDNPRFQSTLQARNLEQKREWTLQLKRVILENYSAVIPSHARQLVMELGQCRPEDENLTEKVPTKRQHSAPEYLERRKQERRKSESTLRARLRRARKSDPGSPKDSPATSRRSRRTSVDSSRERSESRDREVGIDRKMSSASCPSTTNSAEKRLVKKLSGWRRKSEPGFYGKNGKGENGTRENGSFMSPTHGSDVASNYTLDSNDSIIGEVDGELEESASQIDSCLEENEELADIDEGGHDLDHHHHHAAEERRESIEEIVGQLVMQNQEFRRILSKQRLVHLRKALAQHQQRNLHEEETASETETEEQADIHGTPKVGRKMKNKASLIMKSNSKKNGTEDNTLLLVGKPSGSNESEASSSNGIGGSSSDMLGEMSSENISIATSSVDENNAMLGNGNGSNSLSNKNVQRTVSDPGNKATLTPRRFMNGPLAHYDPLSLLWSSFRRSENRSKHRHNGSLAEKSSGKTNIRHTHSFTCSSSRNKEMGSISIQGQNGAELDNSKEPLPHGDSGVFPNSFTSDSSSSSEANIPTLPAVWLKQSGSHLATPNNKSGSLPRSFQVGQHSMPKPPSSPFTSSSKSTKDKINGKPGNDCTSFKSRLRDGKYSDRPFTIASDKPSPSDISYDEMEQYMSKFNAQMARRSPNSSGILTTAEEDVDDLATAELTPVTSMENISDVHPDHKIYRSSKSSIKHILLSVTQRLTGLKANMMMSGGSSNGNVNRRSSTSAVNFGSYPNILSTASSAAGSTSQLGSPDPNQIKENGGSRRKMSQGNLSPALIKGMHMLPRNYRKSLKQKLRYIVKDDRDSDSENCESSVTCSSASSGFSSLGSCESNANHNLTSKIGARLAQSTEKSDYALAKLMGGGGNNAPLGSDGMISRPRSVMSMSSTVTSLSSSTTDEKASSSDGNFHSMEYHDLTSTNGTDSTSSSRSGGTNGNGNNPTKDFYRSGRKAINHRDLYLSYIDQEGEAHSDSDASADSFYERSFEAIESLLESEIFPDSAIYSDASSISSGMSRGNNNWSNILPSSSSTASPENGSCGGGNNSSSTKSSPTVAKRRSSFHSHNHHHRHHHLNADMNSVSILAARLSNTRLPCGSNNITSNVPNSVESVVGVAAVAAAAVECIVAAENRRSRLVRSQVILEKLKHLEECSRFQRNEPPSPSFEGMKSIQERRKELDLWRAGMSNRGEDESETSSQHSTSTINTVIETSSRFGELSPSKSTSFPSSRRCSDTDSSGGNSPLTERAVSRSSCHQHGSASCTNINVSSQASPSNSTGSNDPMPKGWVKLVVGKLQGAGGESSSAN